MSVQLVPTSTEAPQKKPRVHTISVYVSNKPGVLVRLALVFARRGYNIESLIVSSGLQGGFSRTTITCTGDPEVLEQIIKQLTKLVDVVHATDHTDHPHVEMEMAMVKVKVPLDGRTEVLQIAEHFLAKVLDFTRESLIIRVTGDSEKIDHFIDLMRAYDVLEVVRTGKAVMARGTALT